MSCPKLLLFLSTITIVVYGSTISSLIGKATTPVVTAITTGSYISGLYEVNVTLGGKNYLIHFDTGSTAL